MKRLKLAELISALSHALDITEGQPEGHCVRCCWIGMHIGREYGLSETQMWSLYYTLLLKDLGCSSNAARICELYLTDDLSFKRDFKTMGDSLPKVLNFVLKHTGLKAGLAERFRSVLTIMRDGKDIAQELIATRCHRGAEIARLLRFPQDVSDGIYSLDEHFNGQGRPAGLTGEMVPVYSRIALLAQVIEVVQMPDALNPAKRPVKMLGVAIGQIEKVTALVDPAKRQLKAWLLVGKAFVARITVTADDAAHHTLKLIDDDLGCPA